MHDMAACCYFGVNLLNQLDHNFLSHLTDGTPHSSSDLLFSSLVLLVTLLQSILSPTSPSPSFSLRQIILSPTSPPRSYSFGQIIPSPIPIPLLPSVPTGTNFSNSSSLFASSDKIILSPNSLFSLLFLD